MMPVSCQAYKPCSIFQKAFLSSTFRPRSSHRGCFHGVNGARDASHCASSRYAYCPSTCRLGSCQRWHRQQRPRIHAPTCAPKSILQLRRRARSQAPALPLARWDHKEGLAGLDRSGFGDMAIVTAHVGCLDPGMAGLAVVDTEQRGRRSPGSLGLEYLHCGKMVSSRS